MNSFAIIYQNSCVFLIIFETATAIKFQRGFPKVEENLTKPSLKLYWWQSRKPHCFRAAKIKKPHLINNFKKCISPKLIQKIITIFSTNPFIYNICYLWLATTTSFMAKSKMILNAHTCKNDSFIHSFKNYF